MKKDLSLELYCHCYTCYKFRSKKAETIKN